MILPVATKYAQARERNTTEHAAEFHHLNSVQNWSVSNTCFSCTPPNSALAVRFVCVIDSKYKLKIIPYLNISCLLFFIPNRCIQFREEDVGGLMLEAGFPLHNRGYENWNSRLGSQPLADILPDCVAIVTYRRVLGKCCAMSRAVWVSASTATIWRDRSLLSMVLTRRRKLDATSGAFLSSQHRQLGRRSTAQQQVSVTRRCCFLLVALYSSPAVDKIFIKGVARSSCTRRP